VPVPVALDSVPLVTTHLTGLSAPANASTSTL
jgi:hypothetical protein